MVVAHVMFLVNLDLFCRFFFSFLSPFIRLFGEMSQVNFSCSFIFFHFLCWFSFSFHYLSVCVCRIEQTNHNLQTLKSHWSLLILTLIINDNEEINNNNKNESKWKSEEQATRINKWCVLSAELSWFSFFLSLSLCVPFFAIFSGLHLHPNASEWVFKYHHDHISLMNVRLLDKPNGLLHFKNGYNTDQVTAHRPSTSSFAINIYCHRFNFYFLFFSAFFLHFFLAFLYTLYDSFVAEKSYVS